MMQANGSLILTATDQLQLVTGAAVITLLPDGTIQIADDNDSGLVTFNPADGVIRCFRLPSSDPHNEGQLYTEGAPAPGVPVALMVSGG